MKLHEFCRIVSLFILVAPVFTACNKEPAKQFVLDDELGAGFGGTITLNIKNDTVFFFNTFNYTSQYGIEAGYIDPKTKQKINQTLYNKEGSGTIANKYNCIRTKSYIYIYSRTSSTLLDSVKLDAGRAYTVDDNNIYYSYYYNVYKYNLNTRVSTVFVASSKTASYLRGEVTKLMTDNNNLYLINNNAVLSVNKTSLEVSCLVSDNQIRETGLSGDNFYVLGDTAYYSFPATTSTCILSGTNNGCYNDGDWYSFIGGYAKDKVLIRTRNKQTVKVYGTELHGITALLGVYKDKIYVLTEKQTIGVINK